MLALDDDIKSAFDDEVHLLSGGSLLADVDIGDEELWFQLSDQLLDVGTGNILKNWHLFERREILDNQQLFL